MQLLGCSNFVTPLSIGGTPLNRSTLCLPSSAIADMPELSQVQQADTWQRLHEVQLLLQNSDSADEIECSSEEDAASPACMQAASASTTKTSKQQNARVCTETIYISCQAILQLVWMQLAQNAATACKHALH